MQKFDFTAPANGAPQVVNVPGRYLKYVTGNAGGNDAGLIVTPGGKPGSKVLMYPGQAITLPNDGTAGPNAWTIANAIGQAQITGTIVIGNGRIDDNTLQGVVQVVDGGKSRTLAGLSFMGAGLASAVAAQESTVELWNPAASGKRVVVESVAVQSTTGATQIGIGIASVSQGALAAYGGSKLAGGANSQAQIYQGNTATTATLVEPQFGVIGVAASATYEKKFNEPVVLPPGYGLIAWNGTVNQTLWATFEWYEEPNV